MLVLSPLPPSHRSPLLLCCPQVVMETTEADKVTGLTHMGEDKVCIWLSQLVACSFRMGGALCDAPCRLLSSSPRARNLVWLHARKSYGGGIQRDEPTLEVQRPLPFFSPSEAPAAAHLI